MELFSYVVVAVIAIWIGYHVRGIIMLAAFSENPDKIIRMLEQIKKINQDEQRDHGSALPGVEIKSEQVGSVWYAYAAADNQFLGQGNTLEEALDMVADRFPNKKFWCKKPDEYSQSS